MFDDSFILSFVTAILVTEWYISGEVVGMMDVGPISLVASNNNNKNKNDNKKEKMERIDVDDIERSSYQLTVGSTQSKEETPLLETYQKK